jgi:sensor histidine kinase YesM
VQSPVIEITVPFYLRPIAFAFYLLLVIALSIYFTRKFTKHKQAMQLQEMKRTKLENELQLNTLRSKIIPHFTKNVLSAIGHFAMTDKLKAGHYISVFSKFTSLTLTNADKNYVSLQEEMEYIEKYLELEKMRFGDKFDYKIHIDKQVAMNLLIPTMTLHTYCDNAIRHGLVPRKEGGELLIEVLKTPNGVLILVCDNGVGRQRSKELGTQGNGQGLKLVEAQLDFHNQTNEHKMQQQIIDLTDQKGKALGTRVELLIPYGFKFE